MERQRFLDEFKREASREGADGRPKLSSAGARSMAVRFGMCIDRFGVPWITKCEANKEGQ